MYKITFCKRSTITNMVMGKTPVDTLEEAKVFAMACVRKAYYSHRVSFEHRDEWSLAAYWGTEYLGVVRITKV